MTLGELWQEFGAHHADLPLVVSVNGEEAVPIRGGIDFTTDDGEKVLYLTNMEGGIDYVKEAD